MSRQQEDKPRLDHMNEWAGPLMVIALVVALLVACGCTSTGGGPVSQITLNQTSTLQGTGVIGSVMAGPLPLTYPLKWSGDGRVTLQTLPPYVIVDGQLVVEPIYVVETQQAIADGRMVVRVPSGLSPVGTLEEAK